MLALGVKLGSRTAAERGSATVEGGCSLGRGSAWAASVGRFAEESGAGSTDGLQRLPINGTAPRPATRSPEPPSGGRRGGGAQGESLTGLSLTDSGRDQRRSLPGGGEKAAEGGPPRQAEPRSPARQGGAPWNRLR